MPFLFVCFVNQFTIFFPFFFLIRTSIPNRTSFPVAMLLACGFLAIMADRDNAVRIILLYFSNQLVQYCKIIMKELFGESKNGSFFFFFWFPKMCGGNFFFFFLKNNK